MDERTDPRLIALARAGDKDAFGYLIPRYQPMALHLAIQLTGNPDIACELVQEAMLQAYLSLDSLRDNTRFKSWFYGIVLNVCRSYLRIQRMPAVSLDALMDETSGEVSAFSLLASDPQEEIEERELHALMMQAIQQLSARNKAATLLFYYGQMNLREVADNLDISVVAVKSRLQQARKELRNYLLHLYPEMSQIIAVRRKERKMIKVVLSEVIQKEPASIAVLVDESGKRALPVWVGYWEGQAITAILRNVEVAGPRTFNFMASLLQASGSELKEVRIEALKDDMLYAIAKIHHGATAQEIEARPGDALALSMQANSPLFVADDIMEKMGIDVTLQNGKFSREELDTILRSLSKMQPGRPVSGLTGSGVGYAGSKQPQNLDGSEVMVQWVGAGSHNQNYEYGLDRDVKRSSIGSFSIKSKVTETIGFGALLQIIAADEYRGKKVRFSGMVKVEAVHERARFAIYGYGVTGVLAQEYNQPASIRGTHDWQPFDVVLAVPAGCVRLGFGALMIGMGQLWFDEVQFMVVDQGMEATNTAISTNRLQNLDFTQGTSGWSIQENATTGYEYGIDASVKHNGSARLFLKSVGARTEGQAFLVQTVVADAYRGKRVRFAGYARGENVAAWGGLLTLVHGSGGGLTFNSNVQQRSEYDLRIVKTKDWQPYQVVVDVPADSSLIRFGIGLMGPGQVWLADAQFEAVSEDVTVTV